MIKSPFKFLDSYSLEDRNTFFGRDQEITDLFRKVLEGKILLVYGISGTGKSSLVNCGLASKFDNSDWLPINVRRGGNIIDSLNEAVNRHAITSLKKPESFVDKIQSLYLDHFKPVFLIFDQFEELFIFGTQEEKKQFLEIIKSVIRSRLNCNVIFVIREEFLAGMTEFDYDLPEIFSNRYRVEKMKKANAISAIEGPCKVNGIEVEPGFSEELINKLTPSGTDVELTYLQIYLDRIFKIASEGKTEIEGLSFSNEMLNKAGSVSDLLGQFLDEQVRQLDDPDTGMSILKSFVSVQGTKKLMTETNLHDTIGTFGAEITKEELIKNLKKFVDLRILREKDESGHYELRHDALATKIFEKFTAIEKDIIEVRQFIENAWYDWQKRGALLSGDDLEYIAHYESRLYISKDLSSLIEKSKDQYIRAKRRKRNITAAATVALLIIFAGFTIWALNERNKAETQRKLAEQQKDEAIKANQLAEEAKRDALGQKTIAIENEEKAIEAKKLALNAKTIAENELYKNIKNSLTISIEKEQTLYVGVQNPVSITVSGIPSNRLRVTVSVSGIPEFFLQMPDWTPPHLTITGKDGKYNILPKYPIRTISFQVGADKVVDEQITELIDFSCKITVCSELNNGSLDTIGTVNFICKPVPDPVAMLADEPGGLIHKSWLLNRINNGLNKVGIKEDKYLMENSEVTSFKMTINNQGKEESKWSRNNTITQEQYRLLEKLNSQDFLIIDSISAIGPDNRAREVKSLIFQIY